MAWDYSAGRGEEVLETFIILGGGFLGFVSANSKEAPRLFHEDIMEQEEGFRPGEVEQQFKPLQN